MTKLFNRWSSTGLVDEIRKIKTTYTESKIAKNFDTLLKEYYECIDNSNGDDQHNGALLLAVYRGRASEGIINLFIFQSNYFFS